MKPPNWLRSMTIGIVLMANCIQTVLAQVPSAPCNSLSDSLMISAGSAPDMAADQFGYVHIVWQDPSLGIMYAQVGPDGTITVPATSMYPSHGDGFPHIAVDSAGDAHIIASSSGFTGLIYVKVSGGKRVTLNAFYVEPTSADDIYDSSPSIAINPVNQLPVVAAQVVSDLDEFEGFFDPVLVLVYSTFIASVELDAGGNPIQNSVFEAWYDLETESPSLAVSYPSVAVDNAGVTHVVWVYQDPTLTGLTVGYANSASTTWDEIADTPNVNSLEGRPIIIRGSDGNLDVVWSTTAGAVIWTQISPKGIILVDNAIVSQSEAIARWPVLASGSGQLVCSWTDGREGTNSQIYARSLLDTVPECDVSDSPGAADNGAVAIDSSGNPAYVWQDQRSGSAQLYYRATSTGVTITGQVSSACDGSPISGALVQIAEYSVTSDSKGSFSLSGISPATYNVTVSSENYLSQTSTLTISPTTTTLPENVTLSPLLTVMGNVTCIYDDSPIVGVNVSIGSQSGTTDSSGNYEVAGLLPGTYPVTVSGANYHTIVPPMTISSQCSPIQSDFALTPLSSVTGTVTCSCDGSPVVGVTVQIGSQSGITDSSGKYSISGLSSGTYSVTVSGPNYYTVVPPMTIASPCAPITSDFILKPNGMDIAVLNAIAPASSITKSPVNKGTAIQGEFAPANGSINTAACLLGYDHFNWYQEATGGGYAGEFCECPKYPGAWFVDPPQYYCNGDANCLHTPAGGCENADALPFYYNEGSDYPGIYNVLSHTYPNALYFYDQPTVDFFPPSIAAFVTSLVGVKADGTYNIIRTFAWQSTFSGIFGGVNILSASLLDITNGTGGITNIQTDLVPADIPPDALTLMTQSGGSFPVTVQPVSETAQSGGNVTFTIFPTNFSLPMNYQWRANGFDILGATNLTLQLFGVGTNNAGIYDVILSNSNGSIGSAVASFAVLNAPEFQTAMLTTNGQLIISWITAQGKSYQIQSTTNLSNSKWTPLGSTLIATNSTTTVSEPIGANLQQFYRIVLLQ